MAGAVDEQALLRILQVEEMDAATYWGSEIAREQAVAMDRFYARPYGDGSEVPNRSQVVTHDIMDAVNWVMPDLLRHFTQAEDLISVDDDGIPDGDQILRDASDYLRHVVFKDNPGVQIIHDFVFDGLLQKIGVIQSVWNPGEPLPPKTLEGVTPEDLLRYANDPRYQILEAQIDGELEPQQLMADNAPETEAEAPEPAPDAEPDQAAAAPPAGPQGPQSLMPAPQAAPQQGLMAAPAPGQMQPQMMPQAPQSIPTFTIKVQRKPVGKCKLMCLAPEQFRISRRARSIEEAPYHGARFDDVYLADLLRDHPDKASELDPHGEFEVEQPTGMDAFADERITARFPDEYSTGLSGSNNDEERRRLTVMIEYVRGDFDGDNVVELRRIKRTGKVILENDIVTESEFTLWSPMRVSHRAIGISLADVLMDIQKVRTVLMRKALDSLSQSTAPRLAVSKSAISSDPILLDRLLDHEVGDVIPVDGNPAQVFLPLVTPDVSTQAFNAIEYMDRRSEEASGVNRHAMGIQPNAITDTKGGIENLQAAANKRVEQYARWIAVGLETVFGKVLRLLMAHQDQERIVKINGRQLRVDPRRWSDEMTVSVHVGMAAESREKRLAYLSGIAAKQEEILKTAGLDNPWVGPKEYRNTLAAMADAMGEKAASKYFKEIPGNWQPPPAQPDPKTAEAQAKMQLAQAQAQHQAQLDQAKLQSESQMKQLEFQRDTQLEQMKLSADKERQIAELQHETELARAKAEADVQANARKVEAEQAIAQMKAEHEAQLAAHKVNAEVMVARERMQAEMELARWRTAQEIRVAKFKAQQTAKVAIRQAAKGKFINGGGDKLDGEIPGGAGVRFGGQIG